MDKSQQKQIIELIDIEKSRLGSYARVAKKCKVSEATISLMRNNNGGQLTEDLWQKVGTSLGFKPENWAIATSTRDYQYVYQLCVNAKSKRMFQILCDEAGSGKTTGLAGFCNENASKGAFYIKARDWSAKVFLQKIMNMLGMEEPRGYNTADELLDLVIENLGSRTTSEPFVGIDEFDKLKPSAKMMIIYLFNELEDKISFVIAGTQNLYKEITQGVKYSKKGYDEIESRFARSYLPMVGANKKDVKEICECNGVTAPHIIQAIWEEVGTKRVPIKTKEGHAKSELICDDKRRLKRIIQREQLKLSNEK